MANIQKIVPCLWFDGNGEDAAKLYVSVFPRSRITKESHYGKAGHEIHGRKAGSVMTVAFELDGMPLTALNGGPAFVFNEAISLQVMCDDQSEIDHYWAKLGEGGDPKFHQCGWLKDKFGLSWQVVPKTMDALFTDSDSARSERAMTAMLKMKKLDIAALEKAANG